MRLVVGAGGAGGAAAAASARDRCQFRAALLGAAMEDASVEYEYSLSLRAGLRAGLGAASGRLVVGGAAAVDKFPTLDPAALPSQARAHAAGAAARTPGGRLLLAGGCFLLWTLEASE